MSADQSIWTVGVKAGGWDDAVHIVTTLRDPTTFCDQDAASRNLQLRQRAPHWDKGGGWCWSCLNEAERQRKSR